MVRVNKDCPFRADVLCAAAIPADSVPVAVVRLAATAVICADNAWFVELTAALTPAVDLTMAEYMRPRAPVLLTGRGQYMLAWIPARAGARV